MRNLRGGFTIVEILIVIVVIGILASIVTVSYQSAQRRAYEVGILSDAKAMESAVANEIMKNGSLSLSDWDNDGKDDGYFYSDNALASGGQSADIINELNAQLDFKPTKGNTIDVKLTDDGKEFCIRVYNEQDLKYNTAFNAYTRESSTSVNNEQGSCTYREGQSPTVYAGGAIPGAYETVYNENNTYTWPTGSREATHIEVVVIAAGGNGGHQCGGGGGGVTTAIISRSGAPSSFPVVVGQPAALGVTANGGASSFGSYTATGGTTPSSNCSGGSGASGGLGTVNPANTPSQRYGSGANGGSGGSIIILSLLPLSATGGVTGGGGGGFGALTSGQGGANAVYGGGGGGGGGYLLFLCSGQGGGGNPGGVAGGNCNSRTGGNGGGYGGGGGGRGGSDGPSVGRGAPGQVKVLTCFEATCNPIETPAP